MIVTSSYP